MKAVRIAGPDRLVIDDVPEPQAGPGDVVVRVKAAGLNRADLLQRRGLYPPPPGVVADIPGLEFAGVVVSTNAATGPRGGERVFGLCAGGAQAEYVANPAVLVLPTPEDLSDVEAAAIPEAYVTAHDALVTQAELAAGERVLVHAIASGVGLAALHVASLRGCPVFGTTRSAAKAQRVLSLGAAGVAGPDDFDEAIMSATNGEGVDVILDSVGGPYLERNLAVLRERGRLVVLAAMGGGQTNLSLSALVRKRLRIFGTALRGRTVKEKAAALTACARDVLPYFSTGRIRPVVDRTFPLAQAAQAYAYLEENRNVGKVVLTLADESFM
jgi:NADPH2:quinone reductase